MALFYKKIQRGNPSNPTAPKLWYLILMSLGLIKEKEVAKLLADETTLNSKEVKMILYQLFKVIVHLFLEGHTVQSGELGGFRLTSLLTPYHRGRETAGTVRQQLSIKVKDFIHLKI